jgi:hypothetical protein
MTSRQNNGMFSGAYIGAGFLNFFFFEKLGN